MPEQRYDVVRTNGREVEIVARLTLYEARRIVEADRNAGWDSFLRPSAPLAKTYR